MNDSELLQRFARDGSPAAFRELVARHTNFVYSCACQRLRDAHAAQDVTQAVFLTLALKAKGLSTDTPLPGWLFTATRYACAKYQRTEQRRKEREMHASEQLSAPAGASVPWAEIEPHLAAALDALPDKDREAVFTRFYRQGSYRDVADVLLTTEDSARKRVDRALEKLRAFFAKKGVALSAAGLAGLLTANAIQAAPAGLAATASATALAVTTTSILTLTKGALFAMSITNAKTVAVVVGVAVIVTGTALWISHQNQPPPTSAPVTPARSSAPAAVPNLPAPPPTKVTAPVAPQQLNRETLAASLLEALRETDTAKRRARLRALLREVERGDLDWAYEVVAGIAPLKTTPIEDKTGNCRACHTSGLPTGNQMNCAVNARLNEAMQALMFRWGELDPQAALAKAAQFPDSKLAWYAENSAVEGWIEADPLAAITYIRQNEKQSPIRFAFLDALGAWARKDPQAASRYFDTLTPDERALRASNIGRGWAETDPVAASRWAASLPDETMRSRAYSAIASTWSRTNPQAAGEWLNSLPAGRDRDLAVSLFSRTMAGNALTAPSGAVDPQAATKWAATIADETIRGEAYGQIAVALTSREPEAALAWLESLPAGSARDQAAWSASLTAGRENPAAAVTWAELIQDEQKRARAYSSVVSWWAGRDRAAATAWANQLPAGPARDAAIAALGKK